VKISRSVAKITYFLSQKCRIVPFVRKAAGVEVDTSITTNSVNG